MTSILGAHAFRLVLSAMVVGSFLSVGFAQDVAKWQAQMQEAAKARQENRPNDIEPHLTAALAEAEYFGPTSEHVMVTLNALVTFHYERRTFAQAQPAIARMVEIREKTTGPLHPLFAHTVTNAGVIEALAGLFPEGEAHVRKGLQVSEEIAKGFSSWRTVAAGANHTCAIDSSGKVYCWGANTSGQLGIASPLSTGFPTPVPKVSSATEIAAGGDSACALLTDGSVICWGNNSSGQTGSSPRNRAEPAKVQGVESALSVSVGSRHACALIEGGIVKCWGNNQRGQLGNGTTTNSPAPEAVQGVRGVTSLAAGEDHTCAATGSEVYCWGAFLDGNVPLPKPTTVGGIEGPVQALGTGANYGCALLEGGKLSCWWASGPEPGGATATITKAAVIQELKDVKFFAAGYAHTCVVAGDGSIQCWGNNREGQLGNGQNQNTMTPVAVAGLPPVKSAAAGIAQTCAILENNTLQCWGTDSYGAPSGVVYGFRSLAPVTIGKDNSTLLPALQSLADICAAQKKFEEAGKLYERAIQWIEKSRGPEDESIAPVLQAYAKMLRDAGRNDDAAKAEERADMLLFKPVLTDVPTRPTTTP